MKRQHVRCSLMLLRKMYMLLFHCLDIQILTLSIFSTLWPSTTEDVKYFSLQFPANNHQLKYQLISNTKVAFALLLLLYLSCSEFWNTIQLILLESNSNTKIILNNNIHLISVFYQKLHNISFRHFMTSKMFSG